MRDQLPEELRLDRCVRGKALRHSFAHLQADRSNELNQFYAYKVIHMKKGNQSSLQMHDMKIEANYVIDGEAEVLLEDDNGKLQSHIFSKGSGWVVPRKRKSTFLKVMKEYKPIK